MHEKKGRGERERETKKGRERETKRTKRIFHSPTSCLKYCRRAKA